MVPATRGTALAKDDEMMRQQDQPSVHNKRSESSAINTVSGN
jgi:hypothetical protein